tara:strand:- start:57 stop:785 length:729 start_codon:yes stop_codon:yes gene_type:complete
MTVTVALMTTFMMLWLIGQLLRECLHEKNAVEVIEKITKLRSTIRRRISTGFTSHLHVARSEDLEEGSGADVGEIELRTRAWSQPANPAFNAEEKNKSGGFMKAAPPMPVRKTTVDKAEQIRKGRIKSIDARRHRKGDASTGDVAYTNPMKYTNNTKKKNTNKKHTPKKNKEKMKEKELQVEFKLQDEETETNVTDVINKRGISIHIDEISGHHFSYNEETGDTEWFTEEEEEKIVEENIDN